MNHKIFTLLVLSALMGWMVLPVRVAQAATIDLSAAMQATVQIIILDGDDQPIASGSGSLITPEGLVLTNYHVIADNPLDDQVLVRVPKNLRSGSYTEYWGQVVQSDADGDLAVVAIAADKKGKALTSKVKFPVIPLGDSDSLTVGEEIYALGYPDISFGQLLVTKGMVSGFYEESGINWIASDVAISHGNSGGLIVNAAGELVAVPTAVNSSLDTSAALAYLRPINDAASLLEGAQQPPRRQSAKGGQSLSGKTTSADGGILFVDDFTSNKAGWDLRSVKDDLATVEYRIVQGHLRAIAAFNQESRIGLTVPDVSAADFHLTVDVEMEKSVGSYSAISVDFRYTADGEFYYLGLSNQGTYAFYRYTGEEWLPLQDWVASSAIDLTPGVTNHIELLAVGNLFTLFVNQEELITVEDPDAVLQDAGKILLKLSGPAKGKFTANIDNLTISTPATQQDESGVTDGGLGEGGKTESTDSQWISNSEETVAFLAPADWMQVPIAQPDPSSTLLAVTTPDGSEALFVALMNSELAQLFDLDGFLRVMDLQMAQSIPFTCRTKKSYEYTDKRFAGVYRVQSNCGQGVAQMVTLAVKSSGDENLLLALGGVFTDDQWMPLVEQVLNSLTVNVDGDTKSGKSTQFGQADAAPSAIVTALSLDVHQGPRTSYRVIDTVQAGDELAVLAQYNACAWLQVETPNGEQGWVPGDRKSVALNTPCDQIPEADR